MRRWWISVLAWTVLVAAVVTSGAAPAALAAPEDGPSLVTTARAQSPIAVRNAQALVDVTVRNRGALAAAAPVTLTIGDLPPGAVLIEAGLLGGGVDNGDLEWSCVPSTSSAECTVVAAGSATPVDLRQPRQLEIRRCTQDEQGMR